MAFVVVDRHDIVKTVKDIYIDGKMIPQGTKFLWLDSDNLMVLAGFTSHLVLGVTLRSIDDGEFITLPLGCLQLIGKKEQADTV